MSACCLRHLSGVKSFRILVVGGFFAFLCLAPVGLFAQDTIAAIEQQIRKKSGERFLVLTPAQTAVTLGSNPVVPNSLQILKTTLPEPPKLYLDSTGIVLTIDWSVAATAQDTLWLRYRLLSRPLHAEWSVWALLDSVSPSETPLWKQWQEEQRSKHTEQKTRPPFTLRGFAEREATVGESVQAPFAGRMHLELEGELESGIHLQGELSDQSLPFQPEGTTTQISALDRIYFRVYDSLWQAEAGDINLQNAHQFLYYNTPLQGVGYQGLQRTTYADSFSGAFTLGIAKGEYSELELQGMEGIQGPYHIYGTSALLQVTALAGSEHIYLDGRLLTRGEDQDYTIDYNLGEIRFMPRCPIHATSRIRIKYTKATQRYTRYLLQGALGARLRNGWQFQLQSYTAYDASSSLQLAGEREAALEALSQLTPEVEALHFVARGAKQDGKTHEGYILIDTVVAGKHYTIYRYVRAGLVDSVYTPNFRYMPSGGGAYIQTQNENNAPVYVWQAPVGGKFVGDYDIGEELYAPKTHQLLQSTLGWRSEAVNSQLTIAYSHYNRNSLLAGSRATTDGLALSTHNEYRLGSVAQQTFWLGAGGRLVFRDFVPVENYLPVDFMRNWGLTGDTPIGTWGEASLWLRNAGNSGQTTLRGNALLHRNFRGFSLIEDILYHFSNFRYKNSLSARYMSFATTSTWLGQLQNELSYQGRYLQPVIFLDGELQKNKTPISETKEDYLWWRGGARLHVGDTLAHSADCEVAYRYDASTLLPTQQPERHTLESSVRGTFNMQQYGHHSALINYQQHWAQYFRTPARHSQTFLAQLESGFAVWKERLQIRWQHSLTTEQTPEWQQHFIRVPDGQGTYTWIDANGDGKEQLDEFVRAAFREQGRYVLQLRPSSVTRATQSGQMRLQMVFAARPHARRIDSLSRWFERWDAELTANFGQRYDKRNAWKALFPLDNTQGNLEGEQTLRATLWFNKECFPGAFYAGVGYTEQRRHLAQGKNAVYERLLQAGAKNPDTSPWIFSLNGEYAERDQKVPYGYIQQFRSQNYLLSGTLGWRHSGGAEQRTEVRQTWLYVRESTAPLRLLECEYSLQIPLGMRWNGELRALYARTHIAALRGNPLAYSLTKGYADGNNMIGNMGLRCKISRHVELAARYELRKLSSEPLQHAGSLSLRTLF